VRDPGGSTVFRGMKVSLFTILGIAIGAALGHLAIGAIIGVGVGILTELAGLLRKRNGE
jgi:hypothetical protein